MLSLNTDRFWTIMFTIPLPLVLSSVAVGQAAAVDPEPIPIAVQSVIEPMKIDLTYFNRGVASALGDVRPVLDLGACQTCVTNASESLCCCTEDGSRPPEVGLQELASNRPVLLRSKGVVVSD